MDGVGQHPGAARRAVASELAADGPVAATLDLRGEVCPYTFLKARLALDGLPAGGILRVVVDNEASARDVPRSLADAGHEILSCTRIDAGSWAILVRRGAG
jgi:tRNA 2-thiouridine synthesizing protein A